MPTSTLWRRSEHPPRSRGGSPVRPSTDYIESLSPEPTLEPPALRVPSPPPSTSEENGIALRGLGLPETAFLDSTSSASQPDHLYYDHNGAAHVGARRVVGAAAQNGRSLADLQEWPSRNSKSSQDSRKAQGKGHTRSGSTIDDLATAAIATSPALTDLNSTAFSRGGPYPPTRPSTSYVHRSIPDESLNGPPAKRIKSERLQNNEWSPRAEKPRTDVYDITTDITNEDALLLLCLKTEVNFKKRTPSVPPTTFPHVQSPVTDRRFSGDWNGQGDLGSQLSQSRERENAAYSKQRDQTGANTQGDSYPTSSTPQNSTFPTRALEAAKQDQLPVDFGDGIPQPDSEQNRAPPKKQRRVKPEVQAEVCAACQRLQLSTVDEEGTVMFWISCDACNRWFHAECAGFKTKADARSVDKYVCKDCEPVHGKTTYVRKSSRARTAIDYAGLNQGVVQSSAETSTHHYVQPIKDGKIALLPDDFARIRPELLTMELIESFGGMKRPFIVPACWNPRFGIQNPSTEVHSDALMDETESISLIDSTGTPRETEPQSAPDLALQQVVDCDQDLLDMVIPRDLTVRKVAELYGPDELVPVIDVKSQETKGQFTLQQWADYYELQGDKPIRNVISLEVSHSPLGKLIRRPKVVRDLDLEDHVWETDSETRTKKRPVQFYCLMSVADSYTDFHIDFGGSSVYYHILKGTKTFFFIPPEDKYLKKYEDWCNSDAQNETWLGDLCGGNCTRVDLHEGDTAFIPAGWIHSVWTPEDSLVIGGNFLTRLDYEMQLKVSNVEKLTKVAPKFRYPYFQKVMWYTLIKYLEDDPLLDEVVNDFHDDPEYTFLRADPVWNEVGDLENTAEPGDPAYNARYYPKAEVVGWPSLRDYLYRTARIDAGLPVPDITKRQIDAVKASVPKGHGDPLLLIKLFAIWCAWKTGNVTVPDWAYSDGAWELEKIEKTKKPENFRLPGERTSSRKAAQAQAQAQAQEEAESTPPVTVENEAPAKQSAKPSSRGNGLRVACEACRKRRIKCRHKSGSETPTRPAPEIRPRSFSNAGLPVLSNGSNLEQFPSPDARFPESVGNSTDLTPLNEQQSSSKKGRTKACEECRKSKVGNLSSWIGRPTDTPQRRCVHDEYGRVDPAKAAEPSKPRGSSSTKRPARLSDESVQSKRARTDDDSLDDMIDPALMTDGTSHMAQEAIEEDFYTPGPFDDDTFTDAERARSMQNRGTDPPAEEVAGAEEGSVGPMPATIGDVLAVPAQSASVDSTQNGVAASKTVEAGGLEAMPVGSRTIPSIQSVNIKAELDHSEYANLMDGHDDTKSTSPTHTSAFATPGPPKAGSSVNGEYSGAANSTPRSRHSSRQAKQVKRYTPEEKRTPTKPYPKPARSDRRASSAASNQTVVTSMKSRRSSSNTSGTTHQIAAMKPRPNASRDVSARPASRASTGGESDVDADERFARELQASENGLRRRTSMRA